MSTKETKKNPRTFVGTVVSDKMQKTIVVRVDGVKTHAKYRKQYAVSERYKVHDEKNEYKVGDRVTFVESRPYSKDKRWRVTGKAS